MAEDITPLEFPEKSTKELEIDLRIKEAALRKANLECDKLEAEKDKLEAEKQKVILYLYD